LLPKTIYYCIFAPQKTGGKLNKQSKMKQILTGIFLVMVMFFSANAQPPKGMGTSDPAAKKVLDAVSAKFKTYKSVQAKFSLKVENGSGKVMGNKSGSVSMKGTKYRVTVTGQEIYCDGSNVWTYDKSANEVTITRLDGSNNTITPQKLFTNFYDKDFLYKLNGESKSGAKTLQEVELTPIDKSKPFHKVLVYVDKAAQSITSTKVFEKTGNKYTYAVSGMNTSGAVTDALFVFDAKKYPGVEVVDLR
jgi:outer membrane lipoprotein carrier protein